MNKRWFENKWPWLLAIPPAAAVIGGFFVLWLAISTNDGLVTEDYYRRGVTINETLAPASIREPGPPRAKEAR